MIDNYINYIFKGIPLSTCISYIIKSFYKFITNIKIINKSTFLNVKFDGHCLDVKVFSWLFQD